MYIKHDATVGFRYDTVVAVLWIDVSYEDELKRGDGEAVVLERGDSPGVSGLPSYTTIKY